MSNINNKPGALLMINASHKVTMAVFRERWKIKDKSELSVGEKSDLDLHQVIYPLDGSVQINYHTYNQGNGFYLQKNYSYIKTPGCEASVLRFIFSSSELSPDQMLGYWFSQAPECNDQSSLVCCHTFYTNETAAILRLDQVDFPPGGVAYRHTHPGGGVRYLTRGSLQLHGTGKPHNYKEGDAWFEDANSEVLAKSNESQPSQFVRMMLLPARYEGKPSFTLVDDADTIKPKLQTNTRFFDHPVSLEKYFLVT